MKVPFLSVISIAAGAFSREGRGYNESAPPIHQPLPNPLYSVKSFTEDIVYDLRDFNKTLREISKIKHRR